MWSGGEPSPGADGRVDEDIVESVLAQLFLKSPVRLSKARPHGRAAAAAGSAMQCVSESIESHPAGLTSRPARRIPTWASPASATSTVATELWPV